MSLEYLNTLNFVMFLLYNEILFKQMKPLQIFGQLIDPNGYGKILIFLIISS
jgi:hypothetical protein